MKGSPVVVSNAAFMLSRLKSVTINIPNPRLPLITILSIIARGTIIEAFSISSDIWESVSSSAALAPSNVGNLYVNCTIRTCSLHQNLLWKRLDVLRTGKDVHGPNDSDHERESLSGPIPGIKQRTKDFRGALVRPKDGQWEEDSEEAHDMKDEDNFLEFG
jgi:hypothetical protein